MKCFERLLDSNFLGNVHSELQLARETLKQEREVVEGFRSYTNDKRTRREVYYKCIEQFSLLKTMEDALTEDTRLLFYIQIDYLIFVFSSKKAQIDDAIRHTYNQNGDLPIYRGRHLIGGTTLHTVLIDTRFSFTPMSPN